MSLKENYFFSPKRDYHLPSWAVSPEVSLLLPVYNHKKYLRESLLSVLSQDIDSLSIHILDDGSKDSSIDSIKDLLNEKNVTYSRQDNQGLPKALNNLKSSIRGKADFITWHSADNFYKDKTCLKKLSTYLAANPDLSLTYGNSQIIDEEGILLKEHNYRKIDQKKLNNETYLDLNYNAQTLSQFNDNFINACFLSRARIEELIPPYKSEALGFEDYLNWLLVSIFDEISHIGAESPMYAYRIHKESLSSTLNNHKFNSLQAKYFASINYLVSSVRSGDIILEQKSTKISAILKSSNRSFNFDKHGKELKYNYINNRIHTGHSSRITEIPLILDNQNYPTRVGVSSDILLTRARKRDLGLFGEEYKNGKMLLFCPDINSKLDNLEISHSQLAVKIGNFIRNNNNFGFILYVENEGELEFSRLIHMSSELSKNLRIVNAKKEEINYNLSNKSLSLLNSLGSCDAVLSIFNFIQQSNNLEKLPIEDLSCEFVLSASASRPLLAPFFIKSIIGFMPNLYCLEKTLQLPSDLSLIKNELTDNTSDSIVRYFSDISAKDEKMAIMLCDIIKSHNIN